MSQVYTVFSFLLSSNFSAYRRDQRVYSWLHWFDFFFLWSKAIILNVKRRLAILCGMLLSGVSDTPQQHSTSNSKTRCLSSVLRFCHVLRCSLTDYNLCFLSSTPPELCFKVTLSERNKKAAQFIDLSRFVQK